MHKVKAVAFYLPQFHPIPENNKWWGKGFTEWTNVAKAAPLFSGHYQPHLPADLGFYDLRLPEVREAQAELAREHGIYGFCYYHYWFHGKRLLNRPFDDVLASGKPDFPFALCWANESWSRIWDGQEKESLILQRYSEEDDLQHIRWLIRAFQDKRYIRVQEKPLFLVYRAKHLPNPLRTTTIWREECRRAGIGEIYLCRVESRGDERDNPIALGFDASVEFQPDCMNLGKSLRRGSWWNLRPRKGVPRRIYKANRIHHYPKIVERMLNKPVASYPRFPGVTPSWDNVARRSENALIFLDSTPKIYEKWLRSVADKCAQDSTLPEKFIFINAWNEWAEGNHLEPCQKWGRAYLEATRRALAGFKVKQQDERIADRPADTNGLLQEMKDGRQDIVYAER